MKLLRFLSLHLGLLKRVPLLPQALDTFLLLWTFAFRRDLARAVLHLQSEVLSWPGVSESIHRFGGIEFDLGVRELGHIHGNGVLDVLLTRACRDDVVAAGWAERHHTLPHSGWVSLSLRGDQDADMGLRLLQLAYQATSDRQTAPARPAPSATQRVPTPSG